MADVARGAGAPGRRSAVRLAKTLAGIVALLAIESAPRVFAQAANDRSDAGVDADDARSDALFGTLNLSTPQPYGNLYSTAPGAEEWAARSNFRFNALAPLNFDSNAEEVGSGGTQSWGTFPVGNLVWAAPAGDLPLRVSANARSEFKRFFDAPDVNVDRLTFSGRLQYIDPSNDQAFSPYIAITARYSYVPTLSDQTEARHDFNLGFNRSFHFDGSFKPVPIATDTWAETVWSFGITAVAQRRLRQPQLSSDALILIPSMSWEMSETWNASFAVEVLGRWYEPDRLGQASHEWEALPIATLEYIIPASLFGSDRVSNRLGRPAIDLQVSHLKVWSTVPGVSFGQWEASIAVKVGWRL